MLQDVWQVGEGVVSRGVENRVGQTGYTDKEDEVKAVEGDRKGGSRCDEMKEQIYTSAATVWINYLEKNKYQ